MSNLWVPGNGFGWRKSNVENTRPSTAWGATVTPGNNTKGAWAQIFTSSDTVYDTVSLYINVNSILVSAAAKDCLLDIGYDPAGGTSYIPLISDLLVSCAAGLGNGGVEYVFPVRIPAGSSIAARASVNNATVGTARVILGLTGVPRRRELWKVGRYVDTIGTVNSAASAGQSIVPGTTSDGSWVSLGNTTREIWWWEVGIGINDSTMTAGVLTVDVAWGDASNKYIIIEDVQIRVLGQESISKSPSPLTDNLKILPAGVEIFARAQFNTTIDSNYSVLVYGVGG